MFSLLAGLVLLGGAVARAQTIDPHQLYERRCAGCHAPHAGDFARDSLERAGGEVLGRRNGKALRPLLEAGHGKLTAQEIDVMVAHLTAILRSGALFRQKCRICHDRAVLLARARLLQRNSRLVGRYTGRDIAAFLEIHGRLDSAEASRILEMLKRQLDSQAD